MGYNGGGGRVWVQCMYIEQLQQRQYQAQPNSFRLQCIPQIYSQILLKPLSILDLQSHIYSHLTAAQNNEIQRKLNTNICCIYKSILVSSDSFCLITSHVVLKQSGTGSVHQKGFIYKVFYSFTYLIGGPNDAGQTGLADSFSNLQLGSQVPSPTTNGEVTSFEIPNAEGMFSQKAPYQRPLIPNTLNPKLES